MQNTEAHDPAWATDDPAENFYSLLAADLKMSRAAAERIRRANAVQTFKVGRHRLILQSEYARFKAAAVAGNLAVAAA